MLVRNLVGTCINMKYRKLGNGELEVSVACLGTMMFGSQNTEAEAFDILDYYVQHGGNFIDTAEVYAVPIKPEHIGKTEVIIGNWLTARNNRDKIILATKVAGRMAANVASMNRTDPQDPNAENPCHDRKNILAAIEGSLRRLQTDYVDLYQLHWPDRYAPIFGPHRYDAAKYFAQHTSFDEIVATMGELIKAGKIKAWGLSNESTYGVCQLCEAAKRLGVPLPVSIQNDYSLCERHFDTDLTEACSAAQYNIGLLPYGVLAGGVLTNKYLNGAVPENTRHTNNPTFQPRYHSDRVKKAAAKYAALAESKGMSLATLAIAWANSRPSMGSVIIGSTKLPQLEECMKAFDVELDADTLAAIDAIHMEDRNPQWAD